MAAMATFSVYEEEATGGGELPELEGTMEEEGATVARALCGGEIGPGGRDAS